MRLQYLQLGTELPMNTHQIIYRQCLGVLQEGAQRALLADVIQLIHAREIETERKGGARERENYHTRRTHTHTHTKHTNTNTHSLFLSLPPSHQTHTDTDTDTDTNTNNLMD